MCQQHQEAKTSWTPEAPSDHGILRELEGREPFPWDACIFDAHCHPTDTMTSVALISTMAARALTVMSTRSQDQDLVSSLADVQGITDPTKISPDSTGDKSHPEEGQRIIPSFGWHPWFSYQLYDDSASDSTFDGSASGKAAHYDKVLSPPPSSKDPSGRFSAGLPDPQPLSDFIKKSRARLERHPLALIGEIGLDKAFRLPENWKSAEQTDRDEDVTPGGREGRRLSPYRVSVDHQSIVLKAQLRLAGEMNRAVSVHGVQVHGGLYNVLSECWKGHEKEVLSRRQKRRIAEHAEDFSDDEPNAASPNLTTGPKPFPPRVCLHSYSGPVNMLQQYIHPSVPSKVYFSFSTCVNFVSGPEKDEKTAEVIRAVPDDRLLIESDLHAAGEEMDQSLEQICRLVCHIKGWELRQGVETMAQNWREFIFG